MGQWKPVFPDILHSVWSNEDIVSFTVAAHCLSGCGTVAPYHGLGKMTVAKSLKDGKKFFFLGQLDLNIDDVIKEPTFFISDCYGLRQESMTKCRIITAQKRKFSGNCGFGHIYWRNP